MAPENKYLYNGKELNEDYGINLMDYGARWYDGAVGRFTAVDPLAEPQDSWSTYHYVYDNPLKYVDPFGLMGQNIGADGLTDDQWMEASRPGAGSSIVKKYRNQNRLGEINQSRFHSWFNDTFEWNPYGGEEVGRTTAGGSLGIYYSGNYVRKGIGSFAFQGIFDGNPSERDGPGKGVWRFFGYNISFHVEGGITYGHAAIYENVLGVGAGFDAQFGNYLLGGAYNSATGPDGYFLETDKLNLNLGVGVGPVGVGFGNTFDTKRGLFDSMPSGGVSYGPWKTRPINTSLGGSGNKPGKFLGFEGSFGMGVGARFKLGFLVTKP